MELAGLRFLLRGDDPAWHRRILARYEGFLATSGAGAFVIDAAITCGADPADVAAERDTPPAATWSCERLALRAATFSAEADLGAGRGAVAGPALAYPVDALLRLLVAALLDDGLLVHAALLVDGDRAWLAAGPSGSGKSTLAALLPEHAAADELAAVRLGPGDGPLGCGLPFWRGRARQAPLAGIYVLRHAATCARARLTPREAMRRLAPEVVWPLGPCGAVDRRLGVLARLVDRVPVWDLGFRPEREVWSTIAREIDE